eukprot:728274-Rhodomonas_salina.3
MSTTEELEEAEPDVSNAYAWGGRPWRNQIPKTICLVDTVLTTWSCVIDFAARGKCLARRVPFI